MFCAECTLLDIHRDFAGQPTWLLQEGLDIAPSAQGGGSSQTRRERYRCPIAGCGARWLRLSDPAQPGKRRWQALLD
ncbi:MAG TPA: hypothetical protein VFO28_07785 [Burkholderiaceae bacterium]|nr:hypothetical protein [Burkholderiaceae bacterium]